MTYETYLPWQPVESILSAKSNKRLQTFSRRTVSVDSNGDEDANAFKLLGPQEQKASADLHYRFSMHVKSKLSEPRHVISNNVAF